MATLRIASYFGRNKVLDNLLTSKKFKIDKSDKEALHYASHAQQGEAVEKLIKA